MYIGVSLCMWVYMYTYVYVQLGAYIGVYVSTCVLQVLNNYYMAMIIVQRNMQGYEHLNSQRNDLMVMLN